ncbi:MAG: LemA family protein [Oscillospiraceae bacterium]|nr:LemA family protein [Oscillospiraceae bacterium]
MARIQIKKSVKILIVFFLLVLTLGIYCISVWNSFVVTRQKVDLLFSGVEVQLQRRADLIPNLVNVVKGYAAHEEAVFSEVTKARTQMISAKGPDELSAANGELTQALGRLFAVAEAYPELKANENFLSLQDELAGTENRIAIARQDFNEQATHFNASLQTLPKNLIARLFGLKSISLFGVNENAKEVPVVSFK